MPYHGRNYNNIISQPRLSNITHIGMPQTNFKNGQMEYEMIHNQQTRPEVSGVDPQKLAQFRGLKSI